MPPGSDCIQCKDGVNLGQFFLFIDLCIHLDFVLYERTDYQKQNIADDNSEVENKFDLKPANQGSGRCVLSKLGVRKQVKNFGYLNLGVDVKENTYKAYSILETISSNLFVVCDQPGEDQQGMANDGLALN